MKSFFFHVISKQYLSNRHHFYLLSYDCKRMIRTRLFVSTQGGKAKKEKDWDQSQDFLRKLSRKCGNTWRISMISLYILSGMSQRTVMEIYRPASIDWNRRNPLSVACQSRTWPPVSTSIRALSDSSRVLSFVHSTWGPLVFLLIR